MIPVQTVAQVFDDLQRAKAGATAFCTNFFPIQSRLQDWIEHGELFRETCGGLACFFRKDRGFWHFHFCAPSLLALEHGLAALPAIRTEPTVVDLVGREADLEALTRVFQAAGLRPYSRLIRLARPGQPTAGATTPAVIVACAEPGDATAVLALIESSFDRYADTLPMLYELQSAIAGRQILIVKRDSAVSALLFFETQGLTSTVRYWVAAANSQSSGFGSAVIRHYFALQSEVKRFILWVAAENDNAIAKYRHYGYAPDGLADHILVNQLIHP